MAKMLRRAARVVAAGLVLGSCAAESPRTEWREPAMLVEASAPTDARVMVKAEQLFDE